MKRLCNFKCVINPLLSDSLKFHNFSEVSLTNCNHHEVVCFIYKNALILCSSDFKTFLRHVQKGDLDKVATNFCSGFLEITDTISKVRVLIYGYLIFFTVETDSLCVH